jgi:hypothetical protein
VLTIGERASCGSNATTPSRLPASASNTDHRQVRACAALVCLMYASDGYCYRRSPDACRRIAGLSAWDGVGKDDGRVTREVRQGAGSHR